MRILHKQLVENKNKKNKKTKEIANCASGKLDMQPKNSERRRAHQWYIFCARGENLLIMKYEIQFDLFKNYIQWKQTKRFFFF